MDSRGFIEKIYPITKFVIRGISGNPGRIPREGFMKRLVYALTFIPVLCFAEDKDNKNYNIIPLFNYEFVSVENRQYHAPGGGMVFMKGDQNPPLSTERDSLMAAALYQSYLSKRKAGRIFRSIS
jgi:hypothetical protein